MNLVTLTVILLWAGMPLRAESPAAKPDSLVTAFVDAWNTHDPAAFGKLFAPDADWVTASGIRLRGREKIRDFLAEEHAGWARHTRMQATNIHVRPTGDQAASVFFEWEISEEAAGSTEARSPRRGNNLFVVMRAESGWTIVAGQVARSGTAKP